LNFGEWPEKTELNLSATSFGITYFDYRLHFLSFIKFSMNESHINHLLAYPTNAPSAQDLWLTYPERLHQLSEEEADYLTGIATGSMDTLATLLLEEDGGSFRQGNEQLLSSFAFAFDKGVEIVYMMKVTPDQVTELNFQDVFESGGDQLPEHMQLKLTPIIPIVASVFKETIDFAEQHAASVLDTEDLYKSILTGGMLLGVELCLRLDFGDDQEFTRFVEN
jgi:hypothetical protein